MTPVQERVRDFLVQRANLSPSMIKVDTALISSSLIDSFLLVEMVAFIEEAAGVRIPDDFATPEHLDSLALVQRLVDRCKAQGK